MASIAFYLDVLDLEQRLPGLDACQHNHAGVDGMEKQSTYNTGRNSRNGRSATLVGPWQPLTGQTISLQTGQELYTTGHGDEHLYWVEQGVVEEIHLDAHGNEKVFCLAGPGEVCGLVLLNRQGNQGLCSRALTDVVVRPIPLSELDQTSSIALQRSMLIDLSRRLGDLVRQTARLAYWTSEERLAYWLIRLGQVMGETGRDGHIHLRQRLSQEKLAAMVGSTRETVSLCLKRLRQDGMVSYGENRCLTFDPQRLQRIFSSQHPC
ncbi:MAG: Crp/Fnr family transcriptional regulator [Gemmatimonadaceae bacterium]|nr:Crp/Fnr family transcriptional regulator [Gloeobacterales cyanobacterium ES-bin-141]